MDCESKLDRRIVLRLDEHGLVDAGLDDLNSRLISYWFIHKFGKLQRGIFPQFKVNELAMFPMPKTFSPHEKILISLVDSILAAKKSDANTSALEGEIDRLVYQLYGLTPDEIKIVEGKQKIQA